MSTAISPFLNLPSVRTLLLADPTSIPLLTAQLHLLSTLSPPCSSSTLLQARLALVRAFMDQGRLTEAESELTMAEKAGRGKAEKSEEEKEGRKVVLKLLVEVQVGLGRGGRAEIWRKKLEDLEAEVK